LKLLQPEVTGSFEDIWKLIAIYHYKNDLSKFYPNNILENHFAFDIVQQEREIIERCSYLQSFLPDVIEPTDETYKKIKKLMSKIKPLSESEKEINKEKLKKVKDKQDYVLKEFGLK